jgi:hypothetical protein
MPTRTPKFKPHAIVLVVPPQRGQIHCAATVGTRCLRIELTGDSFTFLRQALTKLRDLHPFWKVKVYGVCVNMRPDFCIEADLEGNIVAIHDSPKHCPIAYLETIH